jgi:hypothetical protein
MSAEELRALEAITLNWTRDLKDVWSPCGYHIEDLHPEATRLIQQGISEAAEISTQNPLGVALQGEGGVGKTHLLGWTREQVQARGGYFFLVGDLSRTGFWDEILRTIVEQLQPLDDGSRNQLEALLTDLAEKAGLDGAVHAVVTGQREPSPEDVSAFVAALRHLARSTIMLQDTARALVLLASPQVSHQDVGYNFLARGEVSDEDRRRWGLYSRPKTSQFLIQELSALLALSGPTVLAVDQIDSLIDEVNRAANADGPQTDAVRDVTSGLMGLRDLSRRTVTVISCLPETWEYVRKNSVRTVVARFGDPITLQNIPSADVGRVMIEKRFAPGFARLEFEPSYPSWPIRPEAFGDAWSYTARTLLQRVNAHINMCLNEKVVQELDRLDGAPEVTPIRRPEVIPGNRPQANDEDLAALDARFHGLRGTADISAALVRETEDEQMSALLAAGLDAWIRELGEPQEQLFSTERLSPRNPPLHASLQMITDRRLERQRRWVFRAISAPHYKTVLAQVRKAVAAAGFGAEGTERQLILLRNSPWPDGPVTQHEIAEFKGKGGISRCVTSEDLKTFAALEKMLAVPEPGLRAWLMKRRPAHHTELLSQTLRDAEPGRAEPLEQEPDGEGPAPEAPQPNAAATEVPPETAPVADNLPTVVPATLRGSDRPTIYVGTIMPGQTPVSLPLELLRQHVSVFAGAGSGKTVLLRRLIESCALHGVSSIVLDLNNDLARLGDAWPLVPEHWADGDADLAADYLANTEVVVWTPGVDRGRPVSFQPLPAFADILDDEDELRAKDEFRAAVDAAVGALTPRVNADGRTSKTEGEKAVLKEALSYFGSNGGGSLDEFTSLLSDLPDEASTVPKATGIASELAGRLHIARVNYPLFAGSGESVDPGVLLTPSPSSGKRARVSVISFVGLPDREQQQSFVNQLQMALFSWIKKHPAGDRQLGGLLVMDEAQELAPSGKSTLCRESTLRLVAQARKYGLGMVFATQQPKGLHNSIPNNSTTQLFGFLGGSAPIEAARELARMRGSDLPDVGRLKTGQFYFATQGTGFRKVRTPVCLSYHPSSALGEEEIIGRARASRAEDESLEEEA